MLSLVISTNVLVIQLRESRSFLFEAYNLEEETGAYIYNVTKLSMAHILVTYVCFTNNNVLHLIIFSSQTAVQKEWHA